jgi:hypothetical protein
VLTRYLACRNRRPSRCSSQHRSTHIHLSPQILLFRGHLVHQSGRSQHPNPAPLLGAAHLPDHRARCAALVPDVVVDFEYWALCAMGHTTGSAVIGRGLWAWLDGLDAFQGVGFGMIFLQTLVTVRNTSKLVGAQVIRRVATILDRATALNTIGPGTMFPSFSPGWVKRCFQCVGVLVRFPVLAFHLYWLLSCFSRSSNCPSLIRMAMSI